MCATRFPLSLRAGGHNTSCRRQAACTSSLLPAASPPPPNGRVACLKAAPEAGRQRKRLARAQKQQQRQCRQAGRRFEVTLPKPLGVVFTQKRGGGDAPAARATCVRGPCLLYAPSIPPLAACHRAHAPGSGLTAQHARLLFAQRVCAAKAYCCAHTCMHAPALWSCAPHDDDVCCAKGIYSAVHRATPWNPGIAALVRAGSNCANPDVACSTLATHPDMRAVCKQRRREHAGLVNPHPQKP